MTVYRLYRPSRSSIRFLSILDKGRRRQALLTDEIALGLEERQAQSGEGPSREGATDVVQGQTAASSLTALSDEGAVSLASGMNAIA